MLLQAADDVVAEPHRVVAHFPAFGVAHPAVPDHCAAAEFEGPAVQPELLPCDLGAAQSQRLAPYGEHLAALVEQLRTESVQMRMLGRPLAEHAPVVEGDLVVARQGAARQGQQLPVAVRHRDADRCCAAAADAVAERGASGRRIAVGEQTVDRGVGVQVQHRVVPERRRAVAAPLVHLGDVRGVRRRRVGQRGERDFEYDAAAGPERFVAQFVQRADHAALLRRDPAAVDVDLGAEAGALEFEDRGVPAPFGKPDLAAVPEPSVGGARGVGRNARNRRRSGVVAVDAVLPGAVQVEIGVSELGPDGRGAEEGEEQQKGPFFHFGKEFWVRKQK